MAFLQQKQNSIWTKFYLHQQELLLNENYRQDPKYFTVVLFYTTYMPLISPSLGNCGIQS